jgi:hypothetical protein
VLLEREKVGLMVVALIWCISCAGYV